MAAAAVFAVALLALGAVYVVTSSQRPVALSTSEGSGGLAAGGTSSTSTPSPSPISHVIIILMENEEESSVIGNSSAPYQNSLASSYALAANYFAVAHPSLPNYIALVAGSTFGVNSDCLPSQCSLPRNVTTVAGLLDSHGLTWKEYAESMPINCSQFDSPGGLYFPKHNPFVYFVSITGNNGTGPPSSYCDSHVVSMDQFYVDLQEGNLPNYSFITPNICDDAHSCPLSTGDQWLSSLVPKIINSSSFASSAIFITYDEGATSDLRGGGGQVPCILVSPFAKSGYVSSAEYSHYSLLATVEAIFRLGSLGRNDSTASPMSDLFTPQAGLSQNP
jgi:phosphatidylinositol-3-phosphatase